MAKVVLLCGKLCCGKSTYAAKLREELGAAVISTDEIMLALFGPDAGEKHDEYVEALKKYIFAKSAELAQTGIDAVIDMGFWTRAGRREAREFFEKQGVPCELHYLDVPDDEWRRRVEKRNARILETGEGGYFVDEGLLKKFETLFEAPTEDETDLWVR